MATKKVKQVAKAMARAEGHNADDPLQENAIVMGQPIRILKDRPMRAWEYYEINARVIVAGLQAATSYGDDEKEED